jgi:hypothetical protein
MIQIHNYSTCIEVDVCTMHTPPPPPQNQWRGAKFQPESDLSYNCGASLRGGEIGFIQKNQVAVQGYNSSSMGDGGGHALVVWSPSTPLPLQHSVLIPTNRIPFQYTY